MSTADDFEGGVEIPLDASGCASFKWRGQTWTLAPLNHRPDLLAIAQRRLEVLARADLDARRGDLSEWDYQQTLAALDAGALAWPAEGEPFNEHFRRVALSPHGMPVLTFLALTAGEAHGGSRPDADTVRAMFVDVPMGLALLRCTARVLLPGLQDRGIPWPHDWQNRLGRGEV